MYKPSKGFIKVVPSVLLAVWSLSAWAQKLPSIQKASVYAPANVKIDGRATEWGKFQAYNGNNQIYYTIANDDENLYLIIKTASIRMVQKTVAAGIIFTVNATKSKKDKQHVDITFPNMVRADYQRILRNALKDYSMVDYTIANPIKDTVLRAKHMDTLTSFTNNQVVSFMKMIGVKGVPAIQDSVASIYNDAGIQFNARFDNKMVLTYELAIPLKYLGVSADKPGPFAYHLTFNGVDTRYINTGGGGGSITVTGAGTIIRTGGKPETNQDIVVTNDFWGEYTLAKKQ